MNNMSPAVYCEVRALISDLGLVSRSRPFCEVFRDRERLRLRDQDRFISLLCSRRGLRTRRSLGAIDASVQLSLFE